MVNDYDYFKPFSFPFISLAQSGIILIQIGFTAYTAQYELIMITLFSYFGYFSFKTIFWSKMKQRGFITASSLTIYVSCFLLYDTKFAFSIQKCQGLNLKRKKELLMQYIQLEIGIVAWLYIIALNTFINQESELKMIISHFIYLIVSVLLACNRYNALTLIFHENRDKFSVWQKISTFLYYLSYLQISIFAFAYSLSIASIYISYIVLIFRVFILLLIPVLLYTKYKGVTKFYMKIAYGSTFTFGFFQFLEAYTTRFELVGFLYIPSPMINNFSSKISLRVQQTSLLVLRYLQTIEMLVFYITYSILIFEMDFLLKFKYAILYWNVLISFGYYIIISLWSIIRLIVNSTLAPSNIVIKLKEQIQLEDNSPYQILISQSLEPSIEEQQYQVQRQINQIPSQRKLDLIVFDLSHIEYEEIPQEIRIKIMKYILESKQNSSIIVSYLSQYIYWQRSSNYITFKANNFIFSDLAQVLSEVENIPFKYFSFKFEQMINRQVIKLLQKALVKHLFQIELELNLQKYFFSHETSIDDFQFYETFQQEIFVIKLQLLNFEKNIKQYLTVNPYYVCYDLYEDIQ